MSRHVILYLLRCFAPCPGKNQYHCWSDCQSTELAWCCSYWTWTRSARASWWSMSHRWSRSMRSATASWWSMSHRWSISMRSAGRRAAPCVSMNTFASTFERLVRGWSTTRRFGPMCRNCWTPCHGIFLAWGVGSSRKPSTRRHRTLGSQYLHNCFFKSRNVNLDHNIYTTVFTLNHVMWTWITIL